MPSAAYVAAFMAFLINLLVFATGAAAMLSATPVSAAAAHILPVAIVGTLFLSPALGWVLANRLLGHERTRRAQPAR